MIKLVARAFLAAIFAAAVFAGLKTLSVPETWDAILQWAPDSSTQQQAKDSLAQAEPVTSRCSAPEVIATVKSLLGENSDNPAAALITKMANTSFSLDAIRTVSSSPTQSLCEARLTIRMDIPRPKPDPHDLNKPPETAEAKEFNDQMFQQLGTRVREISYKVEKTDDGQFYITVIPSEADIIEQQNSEQ